MAGARSILAMSSDHKNLLTREEPRLLDQITCDVIFIAHLKNQCQFSDSEAETLYKEVHPFRRNKELLVILRRKDDSAFGGFISTLRETDQNHIASRLEKTLHVPLVFANRNRLYEKHVRSISFLPDGNIGFSTVEKDVKCVTSSGAEKASSLPRGNLTSCWYMSCRGRVLVTIDSSTQQIMRYKFSASGWTAGVKFYFNEKEFPCMVAPSPDNSSVYFVTDHGSGYNLQSVDEGGHQWKVAIGDEDIIDMTVDNRGNCFLLTPGVIFQYDKAGERQEKIKLDASNGEEKAFCVDICGEFMIAYNSGIVRAVSADGANLNIEHIHEGFCPTSIAIDRRVGLVVGAESGLYFYRFSSQCD